MRLTNPTARARSILQLTVAVATIGLALVFIASAFKPSVSSVPSAPPPSGGAAANRAVPPAPRPRTARAGAPVATLAAPVAPAAKSPELADIHAQLRRLMERQMDDEETRTSVLRELNALLTEGNAAEIATSLSRDELQTEFGTAAIAHWLGEDPAAATAWLAAHDCLLPDQGSLLGQALLETPGALDAASAALPNGPFKQAFLNGAALGTADRDPRLAASLANRLEPGAVRTSALETIAYAWAGTDANAAQKWALGIEDPLVRQKVLAAGAKALASADPDLAATWLVAAVKDGAVLDETAVVIAQAWSEKDPAASAAWVATFPEGTGRVAAIEAVLKRWQRSDAAAANAWLLRQPERAQILARLQAEEDEADAPKD